MSGSTDLQIFVRGLGKDVDEAAINETFSKFGSVTKVSMPRHFDTKEPRGFAFVTYENHSECVRASKEMNGQDFSGNRLLVELAKDGFQKTGSFRGRDERDYRSSQRPFGRGSRGGGRGYPSGHRIPSRDFDDDRYRSDEYLNRRYSGAATHHLVDGFRARRSPAPRNFGHRELRSSDRDHYSDRRQNGNMGGRSSPPAPREHERYSTRSRGRRSPGFHGAPRYPSSEAIGRSFPPEPSRFDRNRESFERRPVRSPSPPGKKMRIGEYSHEEPHRFAAESRYSQGPSRDPAQVERSRADGMRRRLPPQSPQAKRIRMDEPSYKSHYPGREASFY